MPWITCFPGRRGWFREYYEDSKSAMPPGLRSWTETEDKAARLSVWCPGTVHGLFQTEDYARVFLSTLASVPAEVVDARLASPHGQATACPLPRRSPGRGVHHRSRGLVPRGRLPEIMAAQMRHLLDVATLPNVTLQVLPAVAHPATASELIIADNSAAYAEHLAAGGVYTDPKRLPALN